MPSRSLAFRKWLTPTNFITIHYACFILACLISAIILWGASTPLYSLSFTDALFLAVSAVTLAGLNTVNLSGLNTFQQFVLFLLIMLGSTIFVSFFVIFFRRRAIEREFAHVAEVQRKSRLESRICGTAPSISSAFRSETVPKKSGAMETKADGITGGGCAIPSGQEGDLLESYACDRNPPQPEQSLGRRSKEYVGNKNGKRLDQISDSLNIRSTNHATTSGADNTRSQSYRRFAEAIALEGDLMFPGSGIQEKPCSSIHLDTARFVNSTRPGPSKEPTSTPHISCEWTTSRSSQTAMLTLKERDRLGSIEYRALKLLEIVVPLYFVLFQLFGCIGIGAWTAYNTPTVAHGNSVNAWWAGAFKAVSAFHNSGLSLFDANMVAFQSSYYVLITMSFLILAGNTCYPIFLRLIFWVLWKLTPDDWTDYKATLQFVLRYPRRVYILLFPALHTWYLLGSVVVLNGISWTAFEILNIGNPYMESIPVNYRVIHGLFQAFAVRFGGFHVVPIGSLAIGVQVLYIFMMYIRPYPILLAAENTDVYEQSSLGVYGPEKSTPTNAEPSELLTQRPTNDTFFAKTGANSMTSFIRQQLCSQFSYDVWWLCLATWLIVIIEGDHYSMDPVTYSVFNIVLEVVSAYGMVGISVGLPNAAYSFCGGWHTLSKLILCAVMLKGRHRDVPVAIDKTVMLTSDSLAPVQEEVTAEKANESAMQ